ncbi:FKBP-type peptidyl-prolyl cis-trans isomerase [Candidatus Cardinium hertigii]|uniref:FKBP-type peptidyl-prolyl cis-trans isomerase n=1 Tax=Candidatus Cardinium hertigii TaxID=247481 RepID=UPI003D7EFAE9
MKRKIVYTALVLSLGLVCYNHQYHCYGYPFVIMPSGLSYKTIGKKSSGKKVQDGQWIQAFITMKVIHRKEANQGSHKESIWMNQQEYIFPFDNNFQSKNKRIAEMIGMMQEKQRVVFKCTPQYYLQQEDPVRLAQLLKHHNLNQQDTLLIDIKLDKIMTDQAYSQMLAESRSAQLAKDKQLIIDYLTTHHIQAFSTDSGLFYTIDQPSQDSPVVKGQTIKVHYTGRLLDGTIFDTSVEEVAKANNLYNPRRDYKPFEFQVGEGRVIQGWEEAFLFLKKHEKARLFIPSTLAYGRDGVKGGIPKNAILLFEVEVVDCC